MVSCHYWVAFWERHMSSTIGRRVVISAHGGAVVWCVVAHAQGRPVPEADQIGFEVDEQLNRLPVLLPVCREDTGRLLQPHFSSQEMDVGQQVAGPPSTAVLSVKN